MTNKITYHLEQLDDGSIVAWVRRSPGYDGPVVTFTVLTVFAEPGPPADDQAGHIIITAGPGASHIRIPAGADVVVEDNCGGGGGP